MRATPPSSRKARASFERQYHAALREYAMHGREAELHKAYELGRLAIQEGKGLIELAKFHHQALSALLITEKSAERRSRLLRESANFLFESLSPYEMVNRGFHDALKALRRMNEVLEEEMKRIAYSVHDDAGQSLVAVHLALAEVSRKLPPDQQKQLRQVEDLLDQAEAQLRHMSHELRPAVLDDLGWVAAIRFLAEGVAKRTGLAIRITSTFNGRLPGAVETALYRIVQEALKNAAKHARATNVGIEIRRINKAISCAIEDDGVGFDVSAVRSDSNRGLGLVGMQERLNAIGGTLSIDSSPARGTKLVIRVFPQ